MSSIITTDSISRRSGAKDVISGNPCNRWLRHGIKEEACASRRGHVEPMVQAAGSLSRDLERKVYIEHVSERENKALSVARFVQSKLLRLCVCPRYHFIVRTDSLSGMPHREKPYSALRLFARLTKSFGSGVKISTTSDSMKQTRQSCSLSTHCTLVSSKEGEVEVMMGDGEARSQEESRLRNVRYHPCTLTLKRRTTRI